ncbi:MAG: hypothetical protein DRH26_00665 [Deltaproteobacteria bacterium]|nr:MAG: hypothetical protein DRH26_00665 [Deltaproteobacteria bacterium]
MSFNFEQERSLEFKYQGVVGYVDAKQFLGKTPYTAAKINGAIKRFCNAEGVEKPTSFIDMETFVSDLADFWLDNNPDVHTDGEKILYRALSNYIAFAIVWKTKAKTSSIFDPTLMGSVGQMITFKNGLGQAVKIINSYAKRNPVINREEVAEGFVLGFSAILPLIANNTLPEVTEELTRLIGAYYAGDKNVLEAAESLKQIEAA